MSMIRSFTSKAAVASRFNATRSFTALAPAFNKLSTPATESVAPKLHPSLLNPAGVRHGGTSILGAGLAMAAVGGCGQGVGTVFAAFIVGLARNPAMKDEMFTYTLMGFAMVEVFFMVVVVASLAFYASE